MEKWPRPSGVAEMEIHFMSQETKVSVCREWGAVALARPDHSSGPNISCSVEQYRRRASRGPSKWRPALRQAKPSHEQRQVTGEIRGTRKDGESRILVCARAAFFSLYFLLFPFLSS